MGGTNCCYGKPPKVRSTLPTKGEACSFRIPAATGFFSSLNFVAYDALAAETTAWLTMSASGPRTDTSLELLVAAALPRPAGVQRPPLLRIEVGPWVLRRLPQGEATRAGRLWQPAAYGNLYVWEASRELKAFSGRDRSLDDASLPPDACGNRDSRQEASLQMVHLGFAGSTNVVECLSDIISGDADLETEATAKESTCALTLGASTEVLKVPVSAGAESPAMTLHCEQPRFDVSYVAQEVRVDVAQDADPLVWCALGFAASKWASPWAAEEAAALAAEDVVRRDLQQAVSLSLAARR